MAEGNKMYDNTNIYVHMYNNSNNSNPLSHMYSLHTHHNNNYSIILCTHLLINVLQIYTSYN